VEFTNSPSVFLLILPFISEASCRTNESRYFALALNLNDKSFIPVDASFDGGGEQFCCSIENATGN